MNYRGMTTTALIDVKTATQPRLTEAQYRLDNWDMKAKNRLALQAFLVVKSGGTSTRVVRNVQATTRTTKATTAPKAPKAERVVDPHTTLRKAAWDFRLAVRGDDEAKATSLAEAHGITEGVAEAVKAGTITYEAACALFGTHKAKA